MFKKFSQEQKQNTVAGDKLSPGTNPGFSKSEEMLSLQFYTQKCFRKYVSIIFSFQHNDCCSNG